MEIILKIQVRQVRNTRLQSVIHMLIGLITCSDLVILSDGILCPMNQAAQLREPGYIHCNLPENFNEVYWFDNISVSSPHVIHYKPNEEVSGPGFDNGEYDVHEDGSLFIKNVTIWHERVYRVIIFKQGFPTPDKLLISLRVTASPVDEQPVIACHSCHQDYYSLTEGEIPSCSFNVARPPVQLEWFEMRHDGYDHVEMQQFNIKENRNGTYNSLATLHPLTDGIGLIHLFVCRAAWPLSDWRREKEILVDFSSNISFSDVTPKVQYMEVNKFAIVPCGEPDSAYFVWKGILSGSEPDIIGFHSHVMTETITNTPDIEVSAEGSLIFSSPQVFHEGGYACIYGDGQKEEIEITSLKLLFPPSPPYIQITGCDDVSHSCVFKENSTKKLTCAVYEARPAATLEWIAEDEVEVSFFNQKVDIKDRGDTSDIILSVEYKVPPDALCGEEILIRCHLYGPLSKMMKAEATALIIPASCKENEVKEENGLDGSSRVLLALFCTHLVVVIAAFVTFYCIHCHCAKSTTATAATRPAYSGVATDDPQDMSKPTGNKESLTVYTTNGIPSHSVKDTDEQKV